MKKIKALYFVLFMLSFSALYANGVKVENISFDDGNNQLSFDLSWQNSFSNFTGVSTHDAVWVFVKYAPNGGDTWLPAKIVDSVAVQNFFQYISFDDLGIMIYKSSVIASNVPPTTFTLELDGLLGGYQDFKVFAIEMVFSDDVEYYVGDGISDGRFYADGNASMPWLIDSEDPIIRGNGTGQFNQVGSTATQNLSADFPKGFNSCYFMKYKITAQQYTEYLNCLTRTQQNTRTNADLSGAVASNKYVMTNTASPMDRNPVACDINIGTDKIEFYVDLDPSNPPNSLNDGANLVLNHLTASDIIAYFDWSGLRPMSELEYEKFCRGALMPAVGGEYAWGSDGWNDAGAITNAGTKSEATTNVGILPRLFSVLPLRSGYSATSTSSRTDASAAYTGAMDMHNLGEFMYGVESLNFTRLAHGDGALDAFGNAVVPAWTVGAQLLCSQDINAPALEPISKGKTIITPITRSAYMGARGVRRLLLE